MEEELYAPGRLLPEARSSWEEEVLGPSSTAKKSYLYSVAKEVKFMARMAPGGPISVSAQLREFR